ncbi:hypothetical protein SLEP1_g23196 [Rubroshorea leprosula]|uniref:Glycerophosphocholine acyltransferase 1 n=1 Tax=Rubroshorea leprosula TaxID=152421 RepID=A0AAV5JIV4_9ROSI|nr:hypothetical protein SLEP1_g23196 [Rubroshorea leprosula]
MHPEGTARRASWPCVCDKSYPFTWLFVVPLAAYTVWQALYFLFVNVLCLQMLLRDPEVMTSYRELSKKAQIGQQYMVAFKWFARRSKPHVDVHWIPSHIHRGNDGTLSSYLHVI